MIQAKSAEMHRVIFVYLILQCTTWIALCTPQLTQVADFSANVYKLASELEGTKDSNLLLCPLSAQTALSLLMQGANGVTLREMTSALLLPKENNLPRLLKDMRDSNIEQVQLLSANKMYARKDFRIYQKFTEYAQNYEADIQNIDFNNNLPAAREINEWVSRRTKGRITDLVSPNELSSSLQLLIINAMYFKANWAFAFNPKYSSEQPFSLLSRRTTKTKMMHQRNKMRYSEMGEFDCRLVDIPYHGSEYTMTIALPNRVDGLPDLEAHVGLLLQQATKQKLIMANVNLTIPQFEINHKQSYNDILKRLGMREAFSDHADFSGIGKSSTRLSISGVLQKTSISVNEEGTIASAATSVGVVTLSIPAPVPSVEFVADHPFLFWISNRKYGVPLFIGRLTRPTN